MRKYEELCKSDKANVVYKRAVASMDCNPEHVAVQAPRNMKQLIDAAQKILAAQFKARFGEAGFQSVSLGSTFAFAVESDKFVQVLHNSYNHWLTISSVGTPPGQMVTRHIVTVVESHNEKDVPKR